jgi:hypothetical protein
MFDLDEWFERWGVSQAARAELTVALTPSTFPTGTDGSESTVSSLVALEAARKGVMLMRNNVGVLTDTRGVPVRFGLMNDSKALNTVIKSADRVGIRSVRIEARHVGGVIGQFVSREIKREGWHYTGTPHERAQMAWALKVCAMGGDACFASGEGTL